ncbi:MAG: prepilin-type N-terminal cleavage/methylation domain-containing protein [Candidatus Gracilibacteria bacterium]|nr:prepilin-type N-terminal cleavage/methylation domain-containing protein [Candidatus Gracilibacteria bacterium]
MLSTNKNIIKIFIKTLKTTKAFTLVELVVVITIIAILSTIAFVGYQQYFGNSRDSNRLQTMGNIETGLQLIYGKTRKYPTPENNILIIAIGTTIGYQGYFGDTSSNQINMNAIPLDPLDNIKYTYSINAKYKKYQLIAFMEGDSQTAYNPIINKAYAIDYTDRIPKIFGSNLGILLDINNNPIQSLSLTGIDVATSTGTYKAIVNNTSSGTITGTGILLIPIVSNYISNGISTQPTCPAGQGLNILLQCVTATQCISTITEITITNGQTWSCMNLGATTVRDGITTTTQTSPWAGNYYQWGRNKGFPGSDATQQATQLTSNPNGNDTYNFVWNPSLPSPYDWINPQIDNIWGGSQSDTSTSNGAGTTNIGRQGPCPYGRHVPSVYDWQTFCNTVTNSTCTNAMGYNPLIASVIKLPFAGYRNRSNGAYSSVSTTAYYWSSSPNSTTAYYFFGFNPSGIWPITNNFRVFGFGLRCVKN